MPYERGDVEAFDEILEEIDESDLPPGFAEQRPTGAFEYRPAEAAFDPGTLGPVARVVLDALRAAGATRFRVRYDGGHDEGFSHPDAVQFGRDGAPRAAEEVQKQIASPALIAAVRAAAGADSVWGNATEMYAKASDVEAAGHALYELAYELASLLLGEGFGTGEYELYGAFTADLITGEITDDPDAAKPPEVD